MQPPPVQGVAPRTEMQILGSQMFHAIENLGRNSQNQLRQLQDQNHAFVEQLQKAAQDAPLSFTEKDPKFPTWDGNRGSLLFWLHQVEQIKEARKLTDDNAVRFARLAMGPAAYGHFDGRRIDNWMQFREILSARFLPTDIKFKLLTELGQHKMMANDFNTYYTQFQAYRQHLTDVDQVSLLCAFVNGLEPHLKHVVGSAGLTTVDEAIELAWKTHLSPAPAWMDYMQLLFQQVQTQTHGQLEQFSQEAAKYMQEQVAKQQTAQMQAQLQQPGNQPATTAANAMQLDPMRSMIMPAGGSSQMYGPVVAATLPVTPRLLGAYQFGRPKSPTTRTWTSNVTEKRRGSEDKPSVYPRSTSPSRYGASSSVTCFNCGQAGHMIRQCPQQRFSTPPRPRIMDRVQEPPIERPRTPSPQPSFVERRSRSPPAPSGGPSASRRIDGACDRCGGQGHFARNCPSRPRTPSPSGSSGRSNDRGKPSGRSPSPPPPAK